MPSDTVCGCSSLVARNRHRVVFPARIGPMRMMLEGIVSGEQFAHWSREIRQEIFAVQPIRGVEDRSGAIRAVNANLSAFWIENPDEAGTAGQVGSDLVLDLDARIAGGNRFDGQIGRDRTEF